MDADTQSLAALNNRARAQTTMAALAAIAAHAADIPGRKNLLSLTANLPFSGEAVARILGRGKYRGRSGGCLIIPLCQIK
jgi:hypothetical protein